MAVPARFGSEFRVNLHINGGQDSASVAALANGKFVVVWEHNFFSDNDIVAQIFNADGSRFGAEFYVTPPSSSGPNGNQQRPVVTATGDGRFAMAWEDYSAAAGQPAVPDIKGLVLNADGSAASGVYANEFLVNSLGVFNSTGPAIAAQPAGGRFLISFSQFAGGDEDVHFRAYNAASAFSSDQTFVDQSVGANEHQSAVAALTNGYGDGHWFSRRLDRCIQRHGWFRWAYPRPALQQQWDRGER